MYISDKKYKCISTKEKSKVMVRKVAIELYQELKGTKEIKTSKPYFSNKLFKIIQQPASLRAEIPLKRIFGLNIFTIIS